MTKANSGLIMIKSSVLSLRNESELNNQILDQSPLVHAINL